MQDEGHASSDVFLVEDVILTLGNLRGSLAWLADPGPSDDPALHRAGLERIGRQIALLEDRARAMRRRMGTQTLAVIAAEDAVEARDAGTEAEADAELYDGVNIFAGPDTGFEPQEDALRRPVLFRTRRSGAA
jgi:hypothetical protein